GERAADSWPCRAVRPARYSLRPAQGGGQMNLVVGATGNVGGAVCEVLRGQAKPLRAMVRETSDPERSGGLRNSEPKSLLGSCVIRGRWLARVRAWRPSSRVRRR